MIHPSFTPLIVALLTVFGLAQLLWPQGFNSVPKYFRLTLAWATPDQARRLERAIEVRSAAETRGLRYARISGAFALLMAASVAFLRLSPALAYAATVLSVALQLTVAYEAFRPSAERRAAPVARRAWYSVFSPVVLAYVAVCVAGAAAWLAFPELRLTVIVLLSAAAIMLFLAGRMATSPSRLPGDDPEAENLVDERIRFVRANGIAAFAGMPTYVFILVLQFPHGGVYEWLKAISGFATAATMLSVFVQPLRKRLLL